jgi:hypothetical protein
MDEGNGTIEASRPIHDPFKSVIRPGMPKDVPTGTMKMSFSTRHTPSDAQCSPVELVMDEQSHNEAPRPPKAVPQV